MVDKNSTHRETLVKTMALVRPALATQAYIPALTHICFTDGKAAAYNDISAIVVKADLDLDVCLPGELLIKALGSFSADHIAVQESGATVVLSSGRSKLKIPTMPSGEHPLTLPDTKKANEITISASILKGIERCLLSVGNDPTHPAQMGVTLDANDKGQAILYSTDNFTISRYQTTSAVELPGDSPIILPTFFCQQLVSLAKAFPEDEVVLYIVPGALLVKFGKVAQLFNKTLVDLEPLDFPRIFDKHCKVANLTKRLGTIPDAWEASFARALLVLNSEIHKVTKITPNGNGKTIQLHSTSSMGDSTDTLTHDADTEQQSEDAFYIDPQLVLRASKACGLMVFNEKALALADADATFIHLIAYCAK